MQPLPCGIFISVLLSLNTAVLSAIEVSPKIASMFNATSRNLNGMSISDLNL